MSAMAEGIAGAAWAFGWGLATASGAAAGALLGLITKLPHRAIAAIVSFGAGLLLTAASISTKFAAEALVVTGLILTVGGILAGAALFSVVNATLVSARDRKRCGDCKPQPSEAAVPGSGKAIALGTVLDAVPIALVLGVTLRASGADVGFMVAPIALSNVAQALAATSGMRLALRSPAYIVTLWSGIVVGTAVTTALVFLALGSLPADVTPLLKAFGAGALIAMTAETVLPEAFHNGPRYSGFVAAAGFAAVILLKGTVQ